MQPVYFYHFLSYLSLKRFSLTYCFNIIWFCLALSFLSVLTISNVEANSTIQKNQIQPKKNTSSLNLKNAPIRTLISAISELTGKNFIVDPIISGKVTFISTKEIPESQLYFTFLSILHSYNFEAIEVGDNLFRITPSVNAKKNNTRILNYPEVKDSPELVTTIIDLKYIEATKALEIIRPLIPEQSLLAIYEPANDLIISSSEKSINQIRILLKKIDVNIEDKKTELISLKNSSVADIVLVLNRLATASPKNKTSISISADIRTNTLLIKGKKPQRDAIKKIVSQLDVPLKNSNNIQVINLNYLTASKTADVLTKLMQDSGKKKPSTDSVNIQADNQTNTLIVRGNNIQIKTIRQLIKKIDIRKPQVLVEAIIADISDDFASEIGVQWAGLKGGGFIGSINYSNSSNSIDQAITNRLNGNANLFNKLGSGAVAGVALGNWTLLLNALQNNSKANILSRPSIVTLDNEEAEIFVGENIPLITGTVGGTNPGTTVQRVEVGIKLKVKPKINPNQKITMKIQQEISALNPSVQNTTAVDLITQSRKINTTVSMNNKEIIVLGGLTSNQNQEIVQKVPLLSDIPILGSLFSYKTKGINKKSLMIFLRVVILPENSNNKIYKLFNSQKQIPLLDTPPNYDQVIERASFNKTNELKLKLSLTLPKPFNRHSANNQ